MQQRESGLPFDDIRNLIKGLPELDAVAAKHTEAQLEGVVGALPKFCTWYSACSGRSPSIHRPSLTLFAGTHAVENLLDGGASSEILLQKVTQISEGSAFINRLCHQHDVGLKVFDLALPIPVDDISSGPALDEKACAGTIGFGMEAIAGGTDLLCIAALDVNPTISALSIMAILGDISIDNLVATRPDIREETRTALESASDLIKGHQNNSLEVLRRLGGRETAAICGAILAARTQHIPVILDGYTALAASLVLYKIDPKALEHVKFAQVSPNDEIASLMKKVGIQSVLPSNLAQNAEEGLLIATGIVKSACLLLQGKP